MAGKQKGTNSTGDKPRTPRTVISLTGDPEKMQKMRAALRRLQAKMVLEDANQDVTQLDAITRALEEAAGD